MVSIFGVPVKATFLLNMIYISLAILFWRGTQNMLASDVVSSETIVDYVHEHQITAVSFQYLKDHPDVFKYVTIASSLFLDIFAFHAIFDVLYHNNLKVLFIMVTCLFFRQLCQFMNRVTPPKELLWEDPGVPSLIVTYHVLNDMFFSGHTIAVLVLGSNFFKNWGLKGQICFLLIVLWEIGFVLTTKSHYFMDIYGGVITYLCVSLFYEKYFEAHKRR